MHDSVENLNRVKSKVNEIINKKQLKSDPKIIVVSKKFSIDKIKPLLESGHVHYGENKIQEAVEKWSIVKKHYKNLQLHMIGNLQSNKAKKAVELFDYIHSLDNEKLAIKISQYQKELNKKVKLFIQINLAAEKQKAGISLADVKNFYHYCSNELSLNIIGLMCLPPMNSSSQEYFEILKKNADHLSLNDLSMGMSSDYESAILSGASYLRLGTIILGPRSST
jgi:pyridoxal phosphate enzyme (YggS family)|tara:strand:- start:1715 stop:2383 length:669 start_codon:yes stop_codon:yes gene_type:complete